MSLYQTVIRNVDINRVLQEELDALSLDDPMEENLSEDEDEANDLGHTDEQQVTQLMNETKDQLERAMQERLAAFEHEINMNFKRYEIDYDEIDDLLQKPTQNNEQQIQSNVARECGIEREELDRVRQWTKIRFEKCQFLYLIDSSKYQR